MIRDGVTVERMTLQAPATESDVNWHLRAANLLSGIDLMPRSMPPHSVLVVRRMEDTQPDVLFQSCERWAEHARRRLGDAWQTAARPARGPVPPGATAVWFRDRAEWLACLTRDMLDGTAGGRWWWRNALGRDVPRLAAVWRSEARALPAALQLLESTQTGLRERAVQSLSPAEATEVFAAVLLEYAIEPARLAALGARPGGRSSAPDPASPFTPQLRLLAAVEHIAGDAPSVTTAAVAETIRPERARDRDASRWPESEARHGSPDRPDVTALPGVVAASLPEGVRDGESSAGRAERPLAVESPVTPAPVVGLNPAVRESGVEESESRGTHVTSGAVAIPGAGEVAGRLERVERPTMLPETSGPEPPSRSGEEAVAGVEDAPLQMPGPESVPVHTALGGLWYLVNALEDAGGFERLDNPRAGWRLLAAVAGHLLGEDVPDACWRILATLAEARGTQEVEPDIDTAGAAETVRLHLESARIDGDGVQEVLRIPALLDVTSTHVDVWFGLEHIDVRVRQAGLDRDPGWVPGLGRVILFHFE